MYVIREVVNCRPGKVGQLIDKFKRMSGYHELVSNGRREIYRVEG